MYFKAVFSIKILAKFQFFFTLSLFSIFPKTYLVKHKKELLQNITNHIFTTTPFHILYANHTLVQNRINKKNTTAKTAKIASPATTAPAIK